MYQKGFVKMARRVFFSFKYKDVSRAMVVRDSWVILKEEKLQVLLTPQILNH